MSSMCILALCDINNSINENDCPCYFAQFGLSYLSEIMWHALRYITLHYDLISMSCHGPFAQRQ